jgi:glycosyltransferase involved in cell wall biosynthesis
MVESLPLVTIGIPTYNRANKTLPSTINSSLNQHLTMTEFNIYDKK